MHIKSFKAISGFFLKMIRTQSSIFRHDGTEGLNLGQSEEELFKDKTLIKSMPKFRLRHYAYHEGDKTYGGKLYNGNLSENLILCSIFR